MASAPPQLRPPAAVSPGAARRSGSGQHPRISRLHVSRLHVSRQPSRRAVAEVTRNLAVMISARLPLIEALQAAERQTADPRLATIVRTVRKDVARGRSLSSSMGRHSIFSQLAVQLVEVGEATGLLGDVLLRLADHEEKSEALRRQVRQALVYPVFVLTVAFLATAFLLAFVVPTFAGLYGDFDAELPGATQVVLSLSDALRDYAPYLLIGCGGSVFLAARALKSARGQNVRDRLLLRLPVIGHLSRNAIIARFCRTLSTLLQNGVPLADALALLARSSENTLLAEQLRKLVSAIKRGQALAASLPRLPLFPTVLVHLAAVGEATGRLGHVLEQAAEHYEAEVDAGTQNLSTLLEPVLIVVIGIVLGGILVAMYLPLFELVNVVGI